MKTKKDKHVCLGCGKDTEHKSCICNRCIREYKEPEPHDDDDDAPDGQEAPDTSDPNFGGDDE